MTDASSPTDLPGSQYAQSFGSQAARYGQVRPSYPRPAVDLLLADLPPATGWPTPRILDLGAGTGKLTASLLGRGAEVVAVEPDPQMLAVLVAELPGVRALAGSAERIPLPDNSVDVVVAGQAFHWFPRPDSDRELARVLRPGGTVGLTWNFPDRTVEWVTKLYQASRKRELPWSAQFEQLDPELFTDAEETSLPSHHDLPGPAGLRDLAQTWSWVITRPEREQQAIDRRLQILISQYAQLQGPVVVLPQYTKVVLQHLR